MRKLSLLFVLAAFVSTVSFAQEVEEATKEEVKVEAKKMLQEKAEVQLSELPEAVTKTLAGEFVGFTVVKAYKAKKEGKPVFYVKVKKDGKYTKVVLDAEGKVLSKKEAADEIK